MSGYTFIYPYTLISLTEYSARLGDVLVAVALFNLFGVLYPFALNLEFFSSRYENSVKLDGVFLFSALVLGVSVVVGKMLGLDILYLGEILSAFIVAFVSYVADSARAKGQLSRFLVLVFVGYTLVFGVAVIVLAFSSEYIYVIWYRSTLACLVIFYLLLSVNASDWRGLVCYVGKYKQVILSNLIGLLLFWMVTQSDRILFAFIDADLANGYAAILLCFTSISVVMLSLPVYVGGVIRSALVDGGVRLLYSKVRKMLCALIFVSSCFASVQGALLSAFGIIEVDFSVNYLVSAFSFLIFCTYLALVRVNMAILNYYSATKTRLLYALLFSPVPLVSLLLGSAFNSVVLIFAASSVLMLVIYHVLNEYLFFLKKGGWGLSESQVIHS